MTRAQPPRKPSLRVERALQRDGHRVLAGMDEVGRGALAGPVTVGVVVIDESVRSAPQGVKDSKLLQPHARERMVPRIERWAVAHAVAHASADEIDEIGIIAALRLAGTRALAACGVRPDLVILDGNHDWLTSPEDVGLLAFAREDAVETPPVTTMIKADMTCSSVAAASVLAKVTRDRIMVELGAEDGEHAVYGWTENKGYAAPEHLDALRRHGPSVWHRRSWRLPCSMDDDGGVVAVPPVAVPGARGPAPVDVAVDVALADLERVGER
jgi:ribonuclease HII